MDTASEFIGQLKIDEIFINYDGPKLYSCVDTEGHHYLAAFVAEEGNKEVYLYVPVPDDIYHSIRQARIPLRDAFAHSSLARAWLLVEDLETGDERAEEIAPVSIRADWLPDEDFLLRAPTRARPLGVASFSAGPFSLHTLSGDPDASGLVHSIELGVELGNSDTAPAGNTTWISVEVDHLISRLATSWPYIAWEDGLPLGLEVSSIPDVLLAYRSRLSKEPAAQRQVSESLFQQFANSHDLGSLLKPGTLSWAVITREGRNLAVATEDSVVRIAVVEGLRVLTDLVDHLLEAHREGMVHISQGSVEKWASRTHVGYRTQASIVTGLPPDKLSAVEESIGDTSVWISTQDDPALDEIFAVARMTAHLEASQIGSVLAAIQSASKSDTTVLDRLSTAARRAISPTAYAYDDGYNLSTWLRRRLKLAIDQPVDPERILRDLGVSVSEADLPPELDALAAWGSRHGPVAIINRNGQHSSSTAGRRASLAHEIAHLLFDRDNALPVAEVLGGRVADTVEARARAFGAEFLLPRDVAKRAYLEAPDDAEQVLKTLCERFLVSREVAAWQVRNSDVALTERGRAVLRRYVKVPGKF